MIHCVPPRDEPLTSAEQFGLDLLIDLSRVVPVTVSSANIVHLEITDARRGTPTISECVARGWFIQPADGIARIDRSALRLICEIAGASREQATIERDRLGRIPSALSPLAGESLEREAVISRAAVLLRQAVIRAAGNRIVRLVAPWPDGRRWAAAITHDLDVVSRWPIFTALRVAELTRKGDVGRLLDVVATATRTIGKDPVTDGVQSILDSEQKFGIRSTWFVLCGTPSFSSWTRGDLTYQPECARARGIFDDILRHGGEIGLHGSFETLERGGLFRAQRKRLSGITSSPIAGVRQHFLRLNPATTPGAMAEAGFAYDSSQGFADRNGFRLGVADIVPTWNAQTRSTIGFSEIPFCWMDRALSKYRGIEDPAVWIEDAMALATECRRVEGLWVGVWHPNLVPALGFPGAPEAFAALLGALSSEAPFFGTLRDVLEWRLMRRAARVQSVSADGEIVSQMAATSRFSVLLEDGNGSTVGRLNR